MVDLSEKETREKDPHNIRSRILNYAILIELLLVDFIREYFVKEKDKATKFNDFILNKEFFIPSLSSSQSRS